MTKDTQGVKPHAFIMISSEPDSQGDTLKTLREFPEVVEAHAVYGIYDEMVRVSASSMENFKDVVAKIRGMEHVKSTITMFIM